MALTAEQCNNCVGQRTLQLRGRGIPAIENLAALNDSFDTIDLSANTISVVGEGLPNFERLSSLYLGCNRITKIMHGVAQSVPNLRMLILSSNRISSRANLNIHELARLKKLEVISVLDNPIASDPDLRMFLLHHIPSLRFINFHRITDKERKEAKKKQWKNSSSTAPTAAGSSGNAVKKRRRFGSIPSSNKKVRS